MGIGRNRETGQAEAERKQIVRVEEIETKDGGGKGVVQHHQKKGIESKTNPYREETEISQERDAGTVNWKKYVTFPEQENCTGVTQSQPKSENSSLEEEEDYNDVPERPKACSEAKDFITSNCQEVNRPDSKSANTYVKLWAQKEGQRSDKSPKRIKVQIGSLSWGDTVRFLEAEKAKVLGEIREEQEKRRGCGRDANPLIGTRNTQFHDHVKNARGTAMDIVHDGKGGKEVETERRALGPMDEELKTAEEKATGMKGKQRTERDETCSQELRSLLVSDGKVQQKAEQELRAVDGNKVRLETKSKRGAGQDEKQLARVLRGGQVKAAREQTDARGPQRASLRPSFETVKKTERRATESSALLSTTPNPRDFKSSRFAAGRAETDKGRGVTKQGEGEDDERELQKRALFHLEALKRIEESYNKRRTREAKGQNETPWHRPAHNWDNNHSTGVHETQKHNFRKLQRKGNGGLNALLAPIFEEELKRQFHDFDEISPSNSETDKQVATFRRMKTARLRAAEEQIAAAKARGQQIRAQLKGTPAKVEQTPKARTLEKQADRKETKTGGGECFTPQNANLPAKQAEGRPATYTPSAKRIKEVNEKARVEAELERERRKRATLKEEERRAKSRRAELDYESVELYGRLNRDARRTKLGPTIGYKTVEVSPQQGVKNRFKSPPASPRKAMQTNALQHFANWEKELRTAQRSASQGKERGRERRVTILEAPAQNSRKGESPEPKTGNGEKALISTKSSNRSSPRKQSPATVLPSEPIPDHYGAVEAACRREAKRKKERKEKDRVKVIDERTTESPRAAHRKENCQSLNWIGKLYNTITSFS